MSPPRCRHERHGQGHAAALAQRLRQAPARHAALARPAPDRPHRRGRRHARRSAACCTRSAIWSRWRSHERRAPRSRRPRPRSGSACTTCTPAPGIRKPRKRVGRGEGSGTGKTSGRGQKGYGSRSGAKDRARFEGGQMPIHMRMRKLRGPHMKKSMPFEPFRTHTQPVNLSDLEARFEAGAVVTLETLKANGPGDAQGHPGQDSRQGRAQQGADRPRARLLSETAREASRPPAAPASSSSRRRSARLTRRR